MVTSAMFIIAAGNLWFRIGFAISAVLILIWIVLGGARTKLPGNW